MGEKDNDTQHARLRHGGRQAGMRNLLAPDTPIWPIFGSSRTKPSFWILKALPPRSPDQVLLRELRSMEALGEIKRK